MLRNEKEQRTPKVPRQRAKKRQFFQKSSGEEKKKKEKEEEKVGIRIRRSFGELIIIIFVKYRYTCYM